jgi:hypothetical protein
VLEYHLPSFLQDACCVRVARVILVFTVVLLGCERDPLRPLSASAGQPASAGGAQSSRDAGGAADGSSRDLAPDRNRDRGATVDAGRQVIPGDAAIAPSPGFDAGTVVPGRDAPPSRPADAGVTPRSPDGPVTPQPSDAAVSGGDTLGPGPDSQLLPSTVLPGGACTDSGQCASLPGQIAVCIPPSIGFDSGYCVVPGCSITAQDCPGGAAAHCIQGDDGPICIGTCSPGGGILCRSGYVCQSLGLFQRSVCIPGCLDNTGCPPGTTCFPVSGSPVGQCRDSARTVGDSCAVASDCPQNGLCVSETDFGWPYGYCVTSKCATSADCAAGTACTGDDPDGICVFRCTSDSDCRTAYRCAPEGRAGENVCVPHCTSDSQCENLMCHIGTGLC